MFVTVKTKTELANPNMPELRTDFVRLGGKEKGTQQTQLVCLQVVGLLIDFKHTNLQRWRVGSRPKHAWKEPRLDVNERE